MIVLMFGTILLIAIFLLLRKLRRMEKLEAELEEEDNYTKNLEGLERKEDLLDRHEVLHDKYTNVKERMKKYDD
jgi:hypothetical protein